MALIVREDELHPVTTSLTRTVDLATASVTAIAVAWCAGLIEDSIQGVQEVDQDVDYLRSLWDRMHAPSRTAMIRPHGGKKNSAQLSHVNPASHKTRLTTMALQSQPGESPSRWPPGPLSQKPCKPAESLGAPLEKSRSPPKDGELPPAPARGALRRARASPPPKKKNGSLSTCL